jgi:serine/threonine-protein kinase
MFLNEARLAATLEHSNLARVIDFGILADRYFLAMEYVHGQDLRALLHRAATGLPAGRVPLAHAIYIVQSVAAGLHYAHERRDEGGRPLGLVHRDVSPSNVLLSFDGEVKLGDFGIAKATEHTQATATATLRGKLAYMSPEQARGQALDRRSDVFSLGIILFELTTGFRQFLADTQYQLLNRVAEGRTTAPRDVDPQYPMELETIVMRALAIDPADRYPTALALHEDLGHFAWGAGLRTDVAPQVGEELRALFGDVTYPDLDAAGSSTLELGSPVRPMPPSTPSTTRSVTVPRRSGRSRATLTAMLGLGVALGVGIARAMATGPEPAPSSAVDVSPAVPVAGDAPELAPTPVPDPAEAPAESHSEGDTDEAADPSPAQRPKRQHVHGSRTTKPRRKPPRSKPASAPQDPSIAPRRERLEDWALPPADEPEG